MARPRQMSDRALAAAIEREEQTEAAATRRALLARADDGRRGVASRPYTGATPGGPTHFVHSDGSVLRRRPAPISAEEQARIDAAADATWETLGHMGQRRSTNPPSVERALREGAALEAEDAAAGAPAAPVQRPMPVLKRVAEWERMQAEQEEAERNVRKLRRT